MTLTRWGRLLTAVGLLILTGATRVHAQAELAADGWSGQVQCVLSVQTPGYEDVQTQTWALSGAAPLARNNFRDYPATWTVSGSGSRKPLPGVPGGSGLTETWTRNGSDANAYLTIFEPIGTRNLRIAPGQIPVRATGGLAVTTQMPVPGGGTTQTASAPTDADEWRFPYIDTTPAAGTMSGSRTQMRTALVGWRQPAGAPVTETCTWNFTKGGAGPASSTISRAPPSDRALGTRSVGVAAGSPGAVGALTAPTAAAAVRVGATADLSANIVASTANTGGTSWAGGDYVTYRLTVRNAGPAVANGATITLSSDPAGARVARVSVTCTAENGADCKQSIDPVELDAGVAIPTLPSGASVAIAVIAQVTYRGQDSSGESYPAIVVGAVTAPTGTPDPNPANNSVRQANSVVPRAGSGGGAADLYTLVETQPSSPLTYWPSPGVAKYVVTVWNSGTAAADGAVLMVPRSGGLSKTSLSCSGVNGAVCPTNLTVNQIEEGVVIPKLPARDGHVRVTFEADVTAPLGSSVSVTSYVTAPLGSGDRFSNDNTDTKSNRILLTSTDLDLTRVPASGVRGLQTVVPNAAPTLSAASCTLAGPTLNPPTVWPGGVVLSWAHINGATYTVSSTDFGVVTPSPVTSATYPATVSVSHSAPLHNPTQYEYAVVAEYGKGCGISRVSVTPPRPFVAIAEANRSDAYDVRLTWHIPDGVDSAMSADVGFLVLGPGLPAEGHDDPGFFQTISGSTYRMKAWETWELGIANVPAGEQTWLIVPYWETPLGRSIDASSGARVTFKRP